MKRGTCFGLKMLCLLGLHLQNKLSKLQVQLHAPLGKELVDLGGHLRRICLQHDLRWGEGELALLNEAWGVIDLGCSPVC